MHLSRLYSGSGLQGVLLLLASESPLPRELEGSMGTLDLSPRSARIVTADLTRCRRLREMSMMNREISYLSSSRSEEESLDPVGKTMEELDAFIPRSETHSVRRGMQLSSNR